MLGRVGVTTTAPMSNVIHVIEIWGQSNAQGYGTDNTVLANNGCSRTLPVTTVLYNSNASGLLSGNKDAWKQFGTDSGYGPEEAFVCKWIQNYPAGTQFAVLKQVVGGSSITQWEPPNGTLWPLVTDQIQKAMNRLAAAGYSPVWDGFVTFQGENGAASTFQYLAPSQPEYADHFRNFMAGVRSFVGIPTLPFFVGRIPVDRLTAPNILVPAMTFSGTPYTNGAWDGSATFVATKAVTGVSIGDWVGVRQTTGGYGIYPAGYYFYTAPVSSISGNTVMLDTTRAVGAPPPAATSNITLADANNYYTQYPYVYGATLYRASDQGGPVQFATLPWGQTVGRAPKWAPVARYWWDGTNVIDQDARGDAYSIAFSTDGLTTNTNQPSGQPQWWYHTDSAGYVQMGITASSGGWAFLKFLGY